VREDISTQIIVVTFIAFLATVGVYGIVALIVRMDDFGILLTANKKYHLSVGWKNINTSTTYSH
jgi:predicted DNA repair protein MutK